MEQDIYGYSLCAALALMIFFGVWFIFARKQDKPVFGNYIRSRRIMGAALLVLSANYAVHLLLRPRFTAPDAAILMNLSTYYISAWLFSSALTSLLDNHYLTRRKFTLHIIGWLCFTTAAGAVMILFPSGGAMNTAGIIALTLWFLIYAFSLASRLIREYRKAVRLFDETQSDDIGSYIDWLSVFTWWAVIYGVGCGLFTFIPEKYVFIWILSSIPFYIYLFCSYMNYMLFYERVETALDTEMPESTPGAESVMTGGTYRNTEEDSAGNRQNQPAYYAELEKRLAGWIGRNGFTLPGLTIEDLAGALCTNRTYIAGYIKSVYHVTFREWIADLRIEYAKRMMSEHPEMTVSAVSEASGFLSHSYFTRIFSEKEGASPAKWKRALA